MPHNLLSAFPVRAQCCDNSHPPLRSFPQAADLESYGHMLGQFFPRDPQLRRSVKGTVLETNGDCQYLLSSCPLHAVSSCNPLEVPWHLVSITLSSWSCGDIRIVQQVPGKEEEDWPRWWVLSLHQPCFPRSLSDPFLIIQASQAQT